MGFTGGYTLAVMSTIKQMARAGVCWAREAVIHGYIFMITYHNIGPHQMIGGHRAYTITFKRCYYHKCDACSPNFEYKFNAVHLSQYSQFSYLFSFLHI